MTLSASLNAFLAYDFIAENDQDLVITPCNGRTIFALYPKGKKQPAALRAIAALVNIYAKEFDLIARKDEASLELMIQCNRLKDRIAIQTLTQELE